MTDKGNTVRTGVEDYIFDVMRLVDILLLVACSYVAYYMRHGELSLEPTYIYGVTICGLVYLFTSHTVKLYNLRNFTSHIPQIGLVSTTLTITFLCYVLFLFMLKSGDEISRLWLMYWFSLSYITLLITHLSFLRWFSKKRSEGMFIRNIVLYGDAERTKLLINQFTGREDVKLLAVYIQDGDKRKKVCGIDVINKSDNLKKFCITHSVDDVIMAMNIQKDDAMELILAKLNSLPCNICYCLPPVFFGKYMPSMPLTTAPVVTIFHRPLVGRKVLLKRLEDIVLGCIILTLISPVLIVVSFLMLLSGETKVIFKQARGGFQGDHFTMYKFRSMKVHKDDSVIQQATKEDLRITKLGAILRRTSLDELPQVFNVIKGDMSLVGPRPHAISHDDHYGDLISSYAARNKMKPGITGWAQVNGWRGETDTIDKMEGRVRYDIHYIENWSLWLDIKILFLTAAVFIPRMNKNAY